MWKLANFSQRAVAQCKDSVASVPLSILENLLSHSVMFTCLCNHWCHGIAKLVFNIHVLQKTYICWSTEMQSTSILQPCSWSLC